jgi:hypothetical protein
MAYLAHSRRHTTKLICAFQFAINEIMVLRAVDGFNFGCHKLADRDLHLATNSTSNFDYNPETYCTAWLAYPMCYSTKLICAFQLAIDTIIIMHTVDGFSFACHKLAKLHSPTNS